MTGQKRNDLYKGALVDIVLKKNQATNKLTRGRVERILTNSAFHHRGIKVQLQSGEIGRVKKIIAE